MTLSQLITKLMAVIRITRPWSPGLIRGGQGQLPARIKRSKSHARTPNRTNRLMASQAVRRLLSKMATWHMSGR
jgi:hypothetical protein